MRFLDIVNEDYYSSLISDFDSILAMAKAHGMESISINAVRNELVGFGHAVDSSNIGKVVDASTHDVTIEGDKISFSSAENTSGTEKMDKEESAEKVQKMALDAATKGMK